MGDIIRRGAPPDVKVRAPRRFGVVDIDAIYTEILNTKAEAEEAQAEILRRLERIEQLLKPEEAEPEAPS